MDLVEPIAISCWKNTLTLRTRTDSISPSDGLNVFTLSAKTNSALRKMVQRYAEFIAIKPDLSLKDLCYTANTGRAHHHHRIAIIVRTWMN